MQIYKKNTIFTYHVKENLFLRFKYLYRFQTIKCKFYFNFAVTNLIYSQTNFIFMKRLFLISTVAIASVFLIVLLSCNKEKGIEARLKPADELKIAGLNKNPKYNEIKNNKGGFVIIKARIHKNYPQCTRGFGICDFVLLNRELWHNKSSNFDGEEAREVYVPVLSENDKKFAYVFFDEDISEYSDSELVFEVQAELFSENEEGDNLTILPGIYDIDRTLGGYGGYKVEVQ